VSEVYRELGVEPFINCAGVRTQFGGSNPAPEVLDAMHAAAQAFVDLDELAEATGRRLAALTDAEWGTVTAGTTAALSLATAACIAGNDPELMLRLPRTQGMRARVVMVAGQRFDYDHAILAAGAEIVCARDLSELHALLDESAAMICLLARRDEGPLTLRSIGPIAHRRGVPILVDAAGLSPARPDRWLTAGADMVVYSVGKYLRGPQSTGLLLGRRTLCEAAWRNGPPHQAFGRSMKVGKEEIVGAVAALDRWLNSPAARREREQWPMRLALIEAHLAKVPAITLSVLPHSDFVTAPRLRIQWDRTRTPFDSGTLRARLLASTPRILIHDFWSQPDSIVVDPVNLTDEQAEQVGVALRAELSRTHIERVVPDPRPRMDVTGSWVAHLRFLHGEAEHRLILQQHDREISGRHVSRHSEGVVTGNARANGVMLTARHHTDSLPFYYTFTGTLTEDVLAGPVQLGAASDEHLGPVFQTQFGAGRWRAKRTSSLELP
jgi:D-glucosaminate-6-phosphate ammonia-lyase